MGVGTDWGRWWEGWWRKPQVKLSRHGTRGSVTLLPYQLASLMIALQPNYHHETVGMIISVDFCCKCLDASSRFVNSQILWSVLPALDTTFTIPQ